MPSKQFAIKKEDPANLYFKQDNLKVHQLRIQEQDIRHFSL